MQTLPVLMYVKSIPSPMRCGNYTPVQIQIRPSEWSKVRSPGVCRELANRGIRRNYTPVQIQIRPSEWSKVRSPFSLVIRD
jgi:hypothetical protein